MKSSFVIVDAAAALFPIAAAAQAPKLMSKAEVETLFVGKTSYWSRPDGSARWNTLTKEDGWMFTTAGGPAIKARFTVDETGKLCYKWVTGSVNDGCRVYATVGDKVQSFDPADLSKPAGLLEKVE